MAEYAEQEQMNVLDTVFILSQTGMINNVSEVLTESDLAELGEKVVTEFEEDDGSREDWLKKSEDAMKLAMQMTEPKTFPWPGSANVKYPLLAQAMLQFHARTYPAIVQNDKIVKAKVTGDDPQGLKTARGERVAQHMNYQLTEQMVEWDEDMDRLIMALSIEGCEFKKVYYDKSKGRNVSQWISPKDFVVHDKTRSLDDCPRKTHVVRLYPNQLNERIRSGMYDDVDLGISPEDEDNEVLQEVLEQHRLEDFDDDGVKEPYIVTVHKDSKKVLRVKPNWEPTGINVGINGNIFPAFIRNGVDVAPNPQFVQAAQVGQPRLVRVEPEEYFVKYSMIPSPDGSFYDIGFGQLIGPLQDVIDSTLNRILDSGTLANTVTGFVSEGLKFAEQGHGGGVISLKPNELKKVKAGSAGEIANQIYQFQFPGPSPVLFNMLGLLVEEARKVTGATEIMMGDSRQGETATTTLSRIEQGMKVYSAIYKRIYRSCGKEFKLLYKLNSIYMNPVEYIKVLDDVTAPIEVQITDYQGDGTDIQPVADPSVATSTQKMAKAEFLMQFIGNPQFNQDEIIRRVLEAAEIEGLEKLIIPADQIPEPPPDPKMVETMAKVEKMAAETQKINAQVIEIMEGIDIDQMKAFTELMEQITQSTEKLAEVEGGLNGRGQTGSMEAVRGNTVVPPATEGT